jgi:hypothetical protein
METLGKGLKRAREIAVVPRQDERDWKIGLEKCFKTAHHRRSSQFKIEIRRYLEDDPASDLDALVFECVRHLEVEALRAILAHERMETLSILGWGMGEWETLLQAMPEDLGVSELELRDVDIGSAESASLFALMRRLPAVTSLSLHSVDVLTGPSSPLPDCSALVGPISLSAWGGADVHLLLLRIMECVPLRALDFGGAQIGTEQQTLVAKALRQQTQIEFVCWRDMDASHGACNLLIDACEEKHSLRKFSLRSCRLSGVEDAAADAGIAVEPLRLEKLMTLRSLRVLDLQDNQMLSDDSLVPMLGELGNHRSLERLNLSNTRVGLRGFEALATALKRNKTLTHLWIHWDAEGVRLLVEAMEENFSLIYVVISEPPHEDSEGIWRKLNGHVLRNQRLLAQWAAESKIAYVHGAMSVFLNDVDQGGGSNPDGCRSPCGASGVRPERAFGDGVGAHQQAGIGAGAGGTRGLAEEQSANGRKEELKPRRSGRRPGVEFSISAYLPALVCDGTRGARQLPT